MKKQALYRSFRSKTFSELVGQEHITRILQNQIKTGNISHAYLFCGTRGTGKTSTAQILARAVNCLNPQDGNPCGVCAICALKDNPDIWEIDAASNNGVDQIRDLRENVRFSPLESKYKVYIIDEVHMLSTGAFNALLKTLEEPPDHVVFILATTEPHKLPATILSRCQRFDFRRISSSEIANHLRTVLHEADPSLVYEDKAIDRIAHLADGSMRDALSLLDQCIYAQDNNLTLEGVIATVGAIDDSDRYELVSAIIGFDVKSALLIIDKLMAKGLEPLFISRDLADHFRSIAIAISCGDDANGILELSDEDLIKIRDQAELTNISAVLKFAETFSYLQLDLRRSASSRLLLESAIIRCANPDEFADVASLVARINALESGNKTAIIKTEPATKSETKIKTISQDLEEVVFEQDHEIVPKKIKSYEKQIASPIVDTALNIDIDIAKTSQKENNIDAQNIFLKLQNMQKEGIKRVFSMYKWDEFLQENTLYLTPPKNCIPALLESLKSKQDEFSEVLDEMHPGIKVVFSASKNSAQQADISAAREPQTLSAKASALFGDDIISK